MARMEVLSSSESDSSDDECITTTVTKPIEGEETNPKLADALSKVLKMAKHKPEKKTLVLSKAKLHNSKPKIKQEVTFELVSDPNKPKSALSEEVDIKNVEVKDEDDEKPDEKELKKVKRIMKQEKMQRGRVKPSPLDREKEKSLSKVATRGVVQLFNAVQQQQSTLTRKFNEVKNMETKKEKILKSIDKQSFLDVLRGNLNKNAQSSVAASGSDNAERVEVKEEDEEEAKAGGEPSWKVLRDDFMMGTKLRDWDKKNDENGDIPAKKPRKSVT